MKNITLFTVPRPFEGEFDYIQKNAIESWLLIKPKPQVILLGNDKGVIESAKEFGVDCVSDVKKTDETELGLPYLNDVFKKAQEISESDIVAYINTDILVMQNFVDAIDIVERKSRNFLIIGKRWDVDITKRFDFSGGWHSRLIDLINQKGKLHAATGIDYQIFRKGCWMNQPPFIAGRAAWDNWFTVQALKAGHFVINATEAITVVHQNHEYRGGLQEVRNDKYAKHNASLAGADVYGGFITKANWILSSDWKLKAK